MFNPDWKDLPNAFLVTTRKGKHVFRIRLNTPEILSQLEAGRTHLAIDIPANQRGEITFRSGKSKNTQRPYKGFPFYAWAMEEKNENTQA
jgi:hypothetical protein